MLETNTAVDAHAIAANVADVRDRIARACRRAGRDAGEVTLVGVTKTFPLEAVDAGYAAGLRHFGENKVQELAAKAMERPGRLLGGDHAWHMIGHLQRNKARDAVAQADVFEALDSLRLADELERRCAAADRTLTCLVQVNVSGEASKFGLDPDALYPFLDRLGAHEHLAVAGLMTLAAPSDDPEAVRHQFRLLRTLAAGYAASRNPRVALRELSLGMSGDYEVAVEEGATIVRIGSALFGQRTYAGG